MADTILSLGTSGGRQGLYRFALRSIACRKKSEIQTSQEDGDTSLVAINQHARIFPVHRRDPSDSDSHCQDNTIWTRAQFDFPPAAEQGGTAIAENIDNFLLQIQF